MMIPMTMMWCHYGNNDDDDVVIMKTMLMLFSDGYGGVAVAVNDAVAVVVVAELSSRIDSRADLQDRKTTDFITLIFESLRSS